MYGNLWLIDENCSKLFGNYFSINKFYKGYCEDIIWYNVNFF